FFGQMSEAGPITVQPVMRQISTDYDLGSTKSMVENVWEQFNYMSITNPADSAAWEFSDINGSEFGFERTE
ncbi:unnamed protein product, partial [marine sediment metagenome]